MNEEDILDRLAFLGMSQKELINSVIKRSEETYWTTREERVRREVDRLARKYGNLGMTRRKLIQLVCKEAKRRANRESQNRWRQRSRP